MSKAARRAFRDRLRYNRARAALLNPPKEDEKQPPRGLRRALDKSMRGPKES